MTRSSRRGLLAAALAALAMHLLLLLWLRAAPPVKVGVAEPAAAPARLQLRLDIVPPPALPSAEVQPAAVALPAPARLARLAARPVTAAPPQNVSPASAQAQPAATAQAQPAADEPPPAPATGPAPLDLHLPPTRLGNALGPSSRSQALDDPRSNSERLRADERFGLAFTGVAVRSEKQLVDGTIRIRSGTSCVLAHPARSIGLDPYNNAIHAVPRHVEAC